MQAGATNRPNLKASGEKTGFKQTGAREVDGRRELPLERRA